MKNIITWTKFDVEEKPNDDFEDEIEELSTSHIIMPSHRIYQTLIGPIDLDNNNNILGHFNLWIMDTNFKITKRILLSIQEISGVECILPITQYKCIIGFGKLFESAQVKTRIEYLLCGKHSELMMIETIQDHDLQLRVKEIYNGIKNNNYWFIFVIPNGEIIEFSSDSELPFMKSLAEVKESAKYNHGLLINGNSRGSS